MAKAIRFGVAAALALAVSAPAWAGDDKADDTAKKSDDMTVEEGAGSGEPIYGAPLTGEEGYAAEAARGSPVPAAEERDLLNEVWSANGGGD